VEKVKNMLKRTGKGIQNTKENKSFLKKKESDKIRNSFSETAKIVFS
jgi:hypothetical protein